MYLNHFQVMNSQHFYSTALFRFLTFLFYALLGRVWQHSKTFDWWLMIEKILKSNISKLCKHAQLALVQWFMHNEHIFLAFIFFLKLCFFGFVSGFVLSGLDRAGEEFERFTATHFFYNSDSRASFLKVRTKTWTFTELLLLIERRPTLSPLEHM